MSTSPSSNGVPSQDLPGSRAGGLSSHTIEVFDQRGIAERFLAEGQVAQVAGFAGVWEFIRAGAADHPLLQTKVYPGEGLGVG